MTSADGIKTEREEILSLSSTQEESEYHIVLYSKYRHDKGYKYISVRSPDTAIFFILLNPTTHVGLDDVTILYDTGKGDKNGLLTSVTLQENSQSTAM